MNPLLKLWYRVEAAAAQACLFLVGIAPLPLTLAFADALAWMGWWVLVPRRRIALDNLLQAGVAKNKAEANRIGRAAFRNFVQMIVEVIVAHRRIHAGNWQEHVTIRLSPEAEVLLHDPRQGVLAASAHIGNWDVAARTVSMIKPMCVVYRPVNNPYLDRVLHAGRSNQRLRLLSRLDSHPMRFMQALADGEIVALMIDQHVWEGRVAVDFFGRKAWTTKAVAMLHLATRAPLVAAFALRTGPLKYEVHIVGPITCPRTGDREQDVLRITQELTCEIEKFARKFPEQYMWGHRRWKP